MWNGRQKLRELGGLAKLGPAGRPKAWFSGCQLLQGRGEAAAGRGLFLHTDLLWCGVSRPQNWAFAAG